MRPARAETTDGYVDACARGWYVTDPSTGLTQYVEAEAEAECTARWIAGSRWRGAMPAEARDDAEYAALDVLAVGNADDTDCGPATSTSRQTRSGSRR